MVRSNLYSKQSVAQSAAAGFARRPQEDLLAAAEFLAVTHSNINFSTPFVLRKSGGKRGKVPSKAGGFSVSLLADRSKGLIRTQIEKRTGVKL
jgi:hypothetical protein